MEGMRSIDLRIFKVADHGVWQDRSGLINWNKKRGTNGHRGWQSESKMYEFSVFRYG